MVYLEIEYTLSWPRIGSKTNNDTCWKKNAGLVDDWEGYNWSSTYVTFGLLGETKGDK